MPIEFSGIIPIPRIFDIRKADDFCLGHAGFAVDRAHRFDADAPLYRRISRSGVPLHLSEHHGGGNPAARLRIMTRVETPHQELSAKTYRSMRPGPETTPLRTREIGTIDPFGNVIRFCGPLPEMEDP